VTELSLEIVEGPGSGRKFPLEGSLEIGREPGIAAVLDDELVSRRHARVSPLNGGALVEDLESRNGSFVNGEQIHAPTKLEPGDHLLVGVTVLELRTAAQIASRPTAVRDRPPALAIPPQQPDYIPGALLAEAAPQPHRRLDSLLDVRVKTRARTAPLAVGMVVVIAILLFLATR
jgi:pSer/pThr/pTyr-binding forkhead associated (FHA) protein